MSRATLSVLRLSLDSLCGHVVVPRTCGSAVWCLEERGGKSLHPGGGGCGEGCVSVLDVTVRLHIAMGELVLFGFHFFKETVCYNLILSVVISQLSSMFAL